MNFWNENPLELRRWKPCPPSPDLRARIFAAEPHAEGAIAFDLRDLTRWIVPALGCFLLVMANVSNHLQPRSSLELAGSKLVLPGFSSESGTMPLPDSTGHSGINAFPAKLEWQVATRPATAAVESVGSFLISYTNRLIQ
jgi:hypothetical protein